MNFNTPDMAEESEYSSVMLNSTVRGIMGADDSSATGNEKVVDGKVWQTIQKCFTQTQTVLDQNRILIKEINQNQESKMPENLSRNVPLIRELNNNIAHVVELYGNLSTVFVKSLEGSTGGESTGTVKPDSTAAMPLMSSPHKRIRSS
eukprot:c22588_g1_i2 orf=224-667(+)